MKITDLRARTVLVPIEAPLRCRGIGRAIAVGLGRIGDVTDIVGAADFLVSPEPGYVTGATLHVDGGLLLLS